MTLKRVLSKVCFVDNTKRAFTRKNILLDAFMLFHPLVNFGQDYFKNHSEYCIKIFNDSYPHKDNYYKKVSFLLEYPQ